MSDPLLPAVSARLALAGLPSPGAHLLAGFSGGADSTALLDLLFCFCREHPDCTLSALHVHHGIRGPEADRDADFCEAFCAERKIPFTCIRCDVPALAEASGRSLEEEARAARYEAFADHIRRNPGITHLLTAHHADDQAETILFRLLRGTSVRGLSGIPEIRPFSYGAGTVSLVRPLVSFPRKALVSYCARRQLPFVTDSTNLTEDCSRNKIRHRILPAAEEINPACTDALLRLAAAASADEDYFEKETAPLLQTLRAQAPCYALSLLRPLHPALLSRVLSALCSDAQTACGLQDPEASSLSASHLASMQALLSASAPKQLSLPGGIVFEVFPSGGTVRFSLQKQESDPPASVPWVLPFPENTPVSCPGDCVCFWTRDASGQQDVLQDLKNIYKLFISTHINSDKICGSMILRQRQNRKTDRYLCGGSHKTVKDALSAHHVPPSLRRGLPLFCDDEGILYIPFCGIRDSVNLRYADTAAGDAVLCYFRRDI